MNPRHKSPWALIIIIVILVLFGLFWFSQKPKPVVEPTTTISENKSVGDTSDLEASIGVIVIPDYQEEL